ncbi:MAG: KpsF/GutQ family sugar-phosphate isomerase [Kiritimatiellae bacterium]|nr:KpsF/GutQ family sugar-phosphate isomerase [Kiritimatiellia bacterium]
MNRQSAIERAKQVFDIEIAGLQKTRDSLGASFADTIALFSEILTKGGLVVVTGVGKSLNVAEKMSAIFASTGTRSIVLNPVQAMHGDLGMVAPRDVLLALSFSGESEEILKLVPAIRRHGLKIVAMTGDAGSTLATLADIVLEIPCGAEACPFGMAPTNSTTAMMAMGDALAIAMIDANRFDRESYALNHPAGAIGRALILKVSDIMRTGERFARVSPETTVLDSLMAMTRAQGGSAVVAAEDGTLAGIFTDGDFRRILSTHSGVNGSNGLDLLAQPVSAYMTRKPLFIRDDAYAADLLKVFERRRIDDLPVVDAAGKVVGLVDIQDLPKMKVL